jgi:hypothetical protein
MGRLSAASAGIDRSISPMPAMTGLVKRTIHSTITATLAAIFRTKISGRAPPCHIKADATLGHHPFCRASSAVNPCAASTYYARGATTPSSTSRVLEFDPGTHRIPWSYGGSREQPFESNVRSEQRRLPNGNTLVTESDGGRLFEVTRQGEIVWEYINPVRADGRIPIVCRGQRFARDELENFLSKE